MIGPPYNFKSNIRAASSVQDGYAGSALGSVAESYYTVNPITHASLSASLAQSANLVNNSKTPSSFNQSDSSNNYDKNRRGQMMIGTHRRNPPGLGGSAATNQSTVRSVGSPGSGHTAHFSAHGGSSSAHGGSSSAHGGAGSAHGGAGSAHGGAAHSAVSGPHSAVSGPPGYNNTSNSRELSPSIRELNRANIERANSKDRTQNTSNQSHTQSHAQSHRQSHPQSPVNAPVSPKTNLPPNQTTPSDSSNHPTSSGSTSYISGKGNPGAGGVASTGGPPPGTTTGPGTGGPGGNNTAIGATSTGGTGGTAAISTNTSSSTKHGDVLSALEHLVDNKKTMDRLYELILTEVSQRKGTSEPAQLTKYEKKEQGALLGHLGGHNKQNHPLGQADLIDNEFNSNLKHTLSEHLCGYSNASSNTSDVTSRSNSVYNDDCRAPSKTNSHSGVLDHSDHYGPSEHYGPGGQGHNQRKGHAEQVSSHSAHRTSPDRHGAYDYASHHNDYARRDEFSCVC